MPIAHALKKAKKLAEKKVTGRKLFLHSNKSKNFHFHSFSFIYFHFQEFFDIFATASKSA
jgi:hypothetical protein